MLGKQLKLLRESKQKSQQEVCSALNIEQSTLANYENDNRVPKMEILIKIADYYQCSIDFLLGRSVNPQPTTPSIDCTEISSRVKNLLVTSGKSINDLLPMLKTDILDGKCNDITTFMQDVYIIADFLGVTDEYILGGKELEASTDYFLSDEEKRFFSAFQRLNQDNKDIILGDMKKYIKEQKYESVAADKLEKTGTENQGK